MIRRSAIAVIVVAFLGLLGFVFLSRRPAIAPIERPNPASFTAESIAKGEVLSAVGHCVSCHTRPGGQPFAGGYGVNTPFGIIYGSNITPDPKTGIGLWSLEAFARAMHEGVSQDGSHLFAAFPYNAYTELSDDDVTALYAYLMTRPPVSATVPRNTIPFPLNISSLQEGWKILFFRSGRYRTDPAKSAEWNRGAYLAEALSDCGGCHTPRNALGAEKVRETYAGAVIDNWIAPALTEANPSPVAWTQEELFSYLRTGVGRMHGAAGATMTPVIREGLALSVVPDSDVRAIAIYFSDIDHAGARESDVGAATRGAVETSSLGSGQEYDPDANLYAAACLSCHYNTGTVPLAARPELALSSALTLPEPTNFIQVVLQGVSNTDGALGLVMPAYASSFTDAEVARLAAYLRRTRTTRPPWTDLENKVSAVRRELPASH
ncbi:MAG: Gluconate 2-dehydrogenase (acceptor) [Bryobacterales bacterium]|nr:Gluconate 2-dehydrogenase (acceptor) [Bryobacterales bacterium]